MITKNEKTEIITYAELARRVGDMVLMNGITNSVEDLYENVFNGDMYHEPEEGEDQDDMDAKEIYQLYAISSNAADYLKRNTNELVFYSDDIDAYFWGITHFGTPWDGVDVEVKEV